MQHLITFEQIVELGYASNRVTLARRIRRGEFPAPIRLGARNVAWLRSEIEAWERQRIAERDRAYRRPGAVSDTAHNTGPDTGSNTAANTVALSTPLAPRSDRRP